MKIILIHKAKFATRPPVISSLCIINELGYHVSLITEEVSAFWKGELNNRGIDYYEIPSKQKSVISKVYSYLRFRKKSFDIIESIRKKSNEPIVVWVESAYTLVALGSSIKRYNYILQIQELHENSRMQLNAIGKVIRTAKAIFMPEYNRTAIYQAWFKLRNHPIVLPNKPYFLPDRNTLKSLEEKYYDQLKLIKGKKIIIFQGHIRDITNYVKAIKELNGEFTLLLVGIDYGKLEEWRRIDNTIIHIDYIPAPDYLLFTSYAYIGILQYAPNQVNNIFCAPNKIYEYGAYGVPMIGNDIPGLKYTVAYSGAGEIVDENNVNSIKEKIRLIDSNYEEYKTKSKQLFDSTNNKETISNVLDNLNLQLN